MRKTVSTIGEEADSRVGVTSYTAVGMLTDDKSRLLKCQTLARRFRVDPYALPVPGEGRSV